MTSNSVKPTNPSYSMPAIVIALLLVDSLHFVFARLLLNYLSPIAASFYYMAVATVQIVLFTAVRRQTNWQMLRDHFRFFIVIGFLIAVASAVSVAAITYIDPGTASLIARMNTIFALGFGVLWLKERLTRGEQVGAAIAIAGVFTISFQWGGANGSVWLGTVLVLSANFTYALHTAVVKRYGGEMDFVSFLLFRMMTSTSFLLAFALLRDELVWPRGAQVWWILLLAGTFNVTIGRALYYLALRRFKLSIHTILLTLSPVATILWSLVLFGDWPSRQGLLGGTAVIIGVLIVTMSKRNGQAARSR